MMMNCNILGLGNHLDIWNAYGIKQPILIDITPTTNNHILISGMSGSGKSYAEIGLFAHFILACSGCECYFADFKQDDSFYYLRESTRYYPYKRTLEALDIVYDKFQKRQSGEDTTRHAIILVWDEYVANILALQSEDKKYASIVMNKVAEILMMGRTMNIKFICSCQRPDASVFPSGSRYNFGVIMILGASNKIVYEMLIPEFIDRTKGREFHKGEGVVLLEGATLNFIKIPTIRDETKLQELCMKALS